MSNLVKEVLPYPDGNTVLPIQRRNQTLLWRKALHYSKSNPGLVLIGRNTLPMPMIWCLSRAFSQTSHLPAMVHALPHLSCLSSPRSLRRPMRHPQIKEREYKTWWLGSSRDQTTSRAEAALHQQWQIQRQWHIHASRQTRNGLSLWCLFRTQLAALLQCRDPALLHLLLPHLPSNKQSDASAQTNKSTGRPASRRSLSRSMLCPQSKEQQYRRQ